MLNARKARGRMFSVFIPEMTRLTKAISVRVSPEALKPVFVPSDEKNTERAAKRRRTGSVIITGRPADGNAVEKHISADDIASSVFLIWKSTCRVLFLPSSNRWYTALGRKRQSSL